MQTLDVQRPGLPTYNYPGWIPLLLAPFGAMPLDPAARLWLGLGLMIGAVGLFLLLDEVAPRLPLAFTLFAYALVASEPAIVTFYSGQWGFLQLGLLSLMVVAIRRGHDRAAGLLGAVTIVKPHLFMAAAPMLVRASIVRRRARFAIVFAATVAVAAIASTIAFPAWWATYLSVPAMKAGDIRAAALPNGMRDVFGDLGMLVGLAADLALVGLAFAFSPRSRAYVAVWLSVTFLLAPYIFVYDHMLMIVPLAIATGLIAEWRMLHALLFASLGFAILVAGATLVHAFPGVAHGSLAVTGFVLYALVAMVVAALWPWRSRSDSAALDRLRLEGGA